MWQVPGDEIKTSFKIGNYDVSIDATGVAAVRLDEKGQLLALAAGSMKSFKTGDFAINLDEPTDIALWIDDNGEWQGVIQGMDGEIPENLVKITKNWTRLNIPTPLQ